MTCGKFLYLIGMIWPDNDMCHKIICTYQYVSHNNRHVAYDLRFWIK